MSLTPTAPRVVLAKVGLDGHDRGIKVVARGLRDAGMHVIYAGLWQTPEAVVRTVADEDADWLGLSLLSGAHMTLVPRVLQLLREAGLEHVGVLIGGIIPEGDIPKLAGNGRGPRLWSGHRPAGHRRLPARAERQPPCLTTCSTVSRQRDRLALSRLLSRLASGETAETILASIGPAGETESRYRRHRQRRRRQEHADRQAHRTAIDNGEKRWQCWPAIPQSPLSGGALLGDRFRMPNQPDDGVFIRSLAAIVGTWSGGRASAAMLRLLEAFGFDILILETVGAGQGDTAVRELADVVVLLLQPETGDDLQWEKAGVMEIADIVAIHKADLPGAEQAEAQVKAALNLISNGRAVPVLRVSAGSGEGIEELARVIEAQPLRRSAKSGDDRALLRLAQQAIAAQFAAAESAHDSALSQLIAGWHEGRIKDAEAVNALLHLLANCQSARS